MRHLGGGNLKRKRRNQPSLTRRVGIPATTTRRVSEGKGRPLASFGPPSCATVQSASPNGVLILILAEAKQGKELLERALGIDPGDPGALLELAKIANRSSDPAAGEAYPRRALDRSPDFPEALFVLTESFRLQGKDDEEARQWQERFVQVKDDSDFLDSFVRFEGENPALPAERAALAGATFLRLHDERRGLQLLHRALQKDPQNRIANLLLAQYFEARGEGEQAQRFRERAQGLRDELGAAAGVSAMATRWAR